jgi:hypothetical protein
VVDQRVGHGLHVPGDDLVELVERQADAVIGDAVLGKVTLASPIDLQ